MPTRLTMALARSLPGPSEGKGDKLYFDDDARGLALRVHAGGGRAWIFKYRAGYRSVKVTLGSIDAIDIGKARTRAKDLYAQVRLGRDPAREKQDARQRADETLGQLHVKYLERRKPELHPQPFNAYKRHLERYLKALHHLPVTEITRRMVDRQIIEIVETNGPFAAGATRSTLSCFFAWAIKSGYCETNPVINTNKPCKETPRDRVVSDAEIKRIWAALDDNHYGRILKLLILTGARCREIGDLVWTEVDLVNAVISLPAERVKNGRPHLIPLSSPALAILQSCPRFGERVFTWTGRGFGGWWSYKTELDRRLANDGGEAVPQWTHHDFRRSITTGLNEKFGVAPHIADAVIGHAGTYRTGTAGIYNKSTYLDERRRAINRWGDHIMGLVSGEPVEVKVINLR